MQNLLKYEKYHQKCNYSEMDTGMMNYQDYYIPHSKLIHNQSLCTQFQKSRSVHCYLSKNRDHKLTGLLWQSFLRNN